jgi:hypothetical protein
MKQDIRCVSFEADGTIARYAAGRLPAEDSAVFEDHYLLCLRCQASVRAASGVQRHFGSGAVIRNRRPWMIGLAVATIATVVFFNVRDVMQARRLGAVENAPLYLGSPVRSAGDDQAQLFDAAMTAYGEEHYADALAQLARIESSEGRSVVDFYAGVSALMVDRNRDAQDRFSAVIARGESPFYAEALFYRAKAFLRRGRKASAIADLRAAAALVSNIQPEAAALLRQLED